MYVVQVRPRISIVSESVSFEDYQRRFGASMRTFRRDIAALRDAGLYIDAAPHDYRMTCFAADADAA
jgi:predicted DNA-binding transcriptional regulator YafY